MSVVSGGPGRHCSPPPPTHTYTLRHSLLCAILNIYACEHEVISQICMQYLHAMTCRDYNIIMYMKHPTLSRIEFCDLFQCYWSSCASKFPACPSFSSNSTNLLGVCIAIASALCLTVSDRLVHTYS